MDDNHHMRNESLCKVCGDKASGKHYGVASCDGCRGFFKRSIRRNLEYVCKENGRCIVDVTRRNQCQACRFRKCLQVNMKRDAVQHERAPRSIQSTLSVHYPLGLGPSRYHREFHHGGPFLTTNLPLGAAATLDPSTGIGIAAAANPYVQHAGLLYPAAVFGGFNKPLCFANNTHLAQKPSTFLTAVNMTSRQGSLIKDDEVSSSEESFKRNDQEEKEIRKPLHLPSVSLFPAENVYESAAKLLFLAIKWARTIPSFLQLSYRDQSVLLEESWSELFVLTAAQWALPVDEALLVSNAMAPTTRHSALEEDARKLREIISRLTLLRVDHTEYACLKALVLFKAECRGLCEPTHVELLQDQTHVMLHEYCGQSKSSHKGRFGKLLLTLPAVQAVGKQGLEELLFRQTVGDVAIDKLLGDLAKVANN
ncbi:nuclear receptor subfamily 2 group E member 1-like [Onthophagus taurus]|uniref:nuclear receptor subfamily 2 group E member 1-like n=1 Tax=Onthophagus taurus TaxID=166361 RepID=UPI0039BDF131